MSELEKCFGFFEEGDKDCKECLEENPKMAEKCRKVRELIENDKIDEAFELVGRDIKIFQRMIKNYDEYSPYEGEIAKKEKENIRKFLFLHMWKKIAKKYHRCPSPYKGWDFEGFYSMQREFNSKLNKFLKLQDEVSFKDFWRPPNLYSAVMRGNSENILKKNDIKKLHKILLEIKQSNGKYNPKWEKELKAQSTLRELFGKLYIDNYPIGNSPAYWALESLGYNFQEDQYLDFVRKFNEFKEDVYKKIVGHATKGTKHEVPINYEIDQLFYTISEAEKRKEEYKKYIESESTPEDLRKFFSLILGLEEKIEENEKEIDIFSFIYSYITSKGFLFEEDEITNYYLALKTKPFVILAGISGTGKTKLAQLFAEFMCHENGEVNKDRYVFISVRPDWTDNRGLLGYHNLITDTFHPSKLTELILRAYREYKERGKNAKPYFVILDEMNLAKVEYYFSDFLSALETRRRYEEEIKQEPIELHKSKRCLPLSEGKKPCPKYKEGEEGYCERLKECTFRIQGKEYIPPHIKIPPNIYFTGTINVDETTYMFSPKVLDRANTIELTEVDMDGYQNSLKEKREEIQLSDEDIGPILSDFTNHGEFSVYDKEKIKEAIEDEELGEYYEKLKKLNKDLKDYNMHFGYRVIDEIMLYLYNARELGFDLNKAFDYQIKQKVLPKFHGSKKELEEPLKKIKEFNESNNLSRSLSKVESMLNDLEKRGFASFA